MFKKINLSDLASLGLIGLLSVFSLARFDYLPHFIDGYYHLSVANFFIQLGGWSGWAWWESLPLGSPHLYPPVYHVILTFLIKAGVSGIDSVRITEVLIIPLFFFSIWQVLRRIVHSRFSLLNLLGLSSFFIFYSSVSANIPASLALIFGFWTWFFIKKKKIISAVIFLTLSFYTHAAIPWIFFISLLLLSFLNKEYRGISIKVMLTSLLLALPFLYHELKNISYVTLKISGEAYFSRFSILIVSCGLISLFLRLRNFKRKDFFIPIFLGYLAASILVFLKYPHRFFSAQGIIGLALFSSLLLENISYCWNQRKSKFIYVVIVGGLFFFQPTLNLNGGKLDFKPLDSTYYNFITGKVESLPEFKSLYFPEFYNPIVQIIEKNTSLEDVIASNSIIFSRIFSALTQRPTANSTLWETMPKDKAVNYKYAKLIIWAKLFKSAIEDLRGMNLELIYESDIAYVLLNRDYESSYQVMTSQVSFKIISLIFLTAVFLLIAEGNRSEAVKKYPK